MADRFWNPPLAHSAAVLIILTATSLLVQVAGTNLEWQGLNKSEFPAALCNDFTRAGYFMRKSVPESKKWVIFLESGGLCYSSDTCNRRYFHSTIRNEYARPGDSFGPYGNFDTTEAWEGTLGTLSGEGQMQEGPYVVNPLMTSMQCVQERTSYFPNGFQVEGRDILDTDCQVNPIFCQYNHVVIPYCSSDLWLGEEKEDTRNYSSLNSPLTGDCGCFNYSCFNYNPNYEGLQFTFRGKTIFQSVIQDLLNGSLQTADEVVLVGSSAGGVGVINNAKWVQDTLPTGVRLTVIFDSAWFINFQGIFLQEFGSSVSSSDNPKGLLDVLDQNDACRDTRLGYPCCISAHCLLASKEYYPQNIPTLAVTSRYDIYLLASALADLEPVSSGRSSAGYALDFLRTVGEYGGVMATTLEQTENIAENVSLYVSECLQHVYLSTSSLWGEDGASVFGDSSVELANQLGSFSHTIRSGVWTSRALAADENGTITISDALQIWYDQGLQAVSFRDDCRGPYCNSQCPETFELGDLTSNNWPTWLKLLVAVVIVAVGVVAMVIKILFMTWVWWIERKQVLYLESLAKNSRGTNSKLQFPDCLEEEALSVACLDLHYTVQYRATKVKDERKDNTSPLVLPIAPEAELDDREEDEPASTPSSAVLHRRRTTLFPEEALRALAAKLTPKPPTSLTEEGNGQPYIPSPPPLPPIVPPTPLFSDGSEPAGIFGQRQKRILKGISIYFNPGELVGIMGPSGSGKTTFLDLLTGRRKKGVIEGDIYINGIPVDEVRDWYIANTGYVLQLATPYYEELTVRENLTLAAQMRLPKSFSLREKFERVEQVMEVTGLLSLGDTEVGGSTGPGLSGGQKRRLSIAIQLLKLPSIIFLDEPTSGLDAASSFELLGHLNKLADSNRAVVLTIHQPRLEIFHMFDRLMLLSDGKVAYHGVPDRAYEVFANALNTSYLEHGLIIPELQNHNPADLIMDMLGNQRTRLLITEYYQSSSEPELVKRAIKSARWKTQSKLSASVESRLQFALHGAKKVKERHASTFIRLAALEARGAKRSLWTNTLYLPVIFFAYGFLLGTVYFQQTNPLLVLSGFCVYSVASALFMFPFLYLYYQTALQIYGYERADGIGRAGDIVVQGFIRGICAAFLPVIVCAGVLYLLLVNDDSYNFAVFVQVALVNIALNQTWTAVLICLICAFPEKAFRLSPVIASVAGFTSGFFIPIEDIPWWYRWLSYINPNYYGFSASAFLLLDDFKTDCEGTEFECYPSSGEYILKEFDFDKINPYLHISILLLFTVFYLLLATFSNWYRHTTIGSKFKRLNIILFKKGNSRNLEDPLLTPRGNGQTVSPNPTIGKLAPPPQKRVPGLYSISESEEQERGSEDQCQLKEDVCQLEDIRDPPTSHSRVRVRWKAAARRSVEKLFEAEEGDEMEVLYRAGVQGSPNRPSHLGLSEGGEGVRRRNGAVKSVFLHEGDIHRVWKGKTRERRPLLADIALVALAKKREKDLHERQRSLYTRVAATQAALKDQTEELLVEEDEEEEEKVKEDEERARGQTRMTFKQASNVVRDKIRNKRTSKLYTTPLTEKVNNHMKEMDAGVPGPAETSSAKRQSFPARSGSISYGPTSLGVMSIGQYKAIIRQQRQAPGGGSFAESAYPFQSLPQPPMHSSPGMKRNLSDTEVYSSSARSNGAVSPEKGVPKRAPKLEALKLIAARRKQSQQQELSNSQLSLNSSGSEGSRLSLDRSRSPIGSRQPVSAPPGGSGTTAPLNMGHHHGNGGPARQQSTGFMTISESISPSHEMASVEDDLETPTDCTDSTPSMNTSPLVLQLSSNASLSSGNQWPSNPDSRQRSSVTPEDDSDTVVPPAATDKPTAK